jgi:hypothetical protein
LPFFLAFLIFLDLEMKLYLLLANTATRISVCLFPPSDISTSIFKKERERERERERKREREEQNARQLRNYN